MDEALSFLYRYGSSSLSFSTLQPLCSRYFTKQGYIGYVDSSKSLFKRKRITAVLGDPISSEDNSLGLIDEFVDQYPRSTFVSISESTAFYLREKGYFIVPFGDENWISVHAYSPTWKSYPLIKKSIGFCNRNDLDFRECDVLSDRDISLCKDLRYKWLRTRVSGSFSQSFLTPSPSWSLSFGRKAFFLESKRQIYAYVLCDPVYKSGVIKGYAVSHVVYDPCLDQNIIYGLLHQILLRLKDMDGIDDLSLHVSPFHFQSRECYEWNSLSTTFVSVLKLLDNRAYNFKGLSFMKSRFRPSFKPKYLAFNSRFPFLDVLTIYAYCMGINQVFNLRNYSFTRENW